MKKNKLTAKEKKESIWTTIGRIRGIARNTNNERLLLLIDKISEELDKTNKKFTILKELKVNKIF